MVRIRSNGAVAVREVIAAMAPDDRNWGEPRDRQQSVVHLHATHSTLGKHAGTATESMKVLGL
jgi:hypothetical protein